MKSPRALGPLLVLGLALSAGLAAASPAQAAGPPVTAPDAATAYQNNFVAVFPIKNDHDPDNELLTICRLGTERYKGIDVSYFGDEVDFGVSERAKPGVYTFTYYTCDYTSLVPGTISLTVKELAGPKVSAAGRGKIKVKNPMDFRIRFSYGSFTEDKPDGQVRIGAGEAVVVKVKRHRIDWVCDAKHGTIYCGSGHVNGIVLRGAARPSPSVRMDARLAQRWGAAG